MTKCTCFAENWAAIQTAKDYGFDLDPSHYIQCRYCKAEEEYQRGLEEELNQRTQAFEEFMGLSGDDLRWDRVFDFLYDQGFRP